MSAVQRSGRACACKHRLMLTVVGANVLALVQIAWGAPPAVEVAQDQAQALVVLATADVKAHRMSLAMFRLAQAESLSPGVPVPARLKRQLDTFQARERLLLAQAQAALRAGRLEAVHETMAQLLVEDARSPAALALMLQANAALTQRGGQYQRHRWYAAEPKAGSMSAAASGGKAREAPSAFVGDLSRRAAGSRDADGCTAQGPWRRGGC